MGLAVVDRAVARGRLVVVDQLLGGEQLLIVGQARRIGDGRLWTGRRLGFPRRVL